MEEVVEGDFRVGPWLVKPSLNAISRNGTTVHLEPKVMEVLVCLAQHAGEALPKEKLFQTVWPDTFVTDDVLKRCIAELRRVFEDNVRDPHIIQTIPKRGYRLVAPVEQVNGAEGVSSAVQSPLRSSVMGMGARRLWKGALTVGSAALLSVLLIVVDGSRLREWLVGGSGAPPIHSIAVLPLQNLSGDPAQEYFSDGMTDALITDLAQIGSLKVISRTSSMQYKATKKSLPEIARELNVDGIVEGTVQRSGDRVRITAQLIHGASDRHLWANTYERETRDVFTLERDVTEDIVRQIQAHVAIHKQPILGQPRQVNPDALDAYLQGNYHLRRFGKGSGDEEKRNAGKYFQHAIEADRNFGPAYVGLANAHSWLMWPLDQDTVIVVKATESALDIDPNLAEARMTLADIRFSRNWDFRGGEEEVRRALELSPNNANVHTKLCGFLYFMGRREEALRECDLSQELDPAGDHQRDVDALYLAGKEDQAIALAKMLLQTDPDDGYLHHALYRYYARKGMYKEAAQEAEKVLVLFGDRDGGKRVQQVLSSSGGRAALRQFAREAEHWITMRRGYFPVNIAGIYAVLGDKDRAFYWLEEAYKHHDTAWLSTDIPLESLKSERMFDSLRSDPRYKDLVRRIGLAP